MLQDTIYSLLRSVTELAPEAPALLGEQQKALSYMQLLQLIENTAQALNAFGLGRGDNVAIVLPNGPEAATCFLSVASATACAPLNTVYSAAEFEFYLSDLKSKAVIVDSRSESPAIAVAHSLGIPVIRLVTLSNEPAGTFRLEGLKDGKGDQISFAELDDLALLLHTSGTTSRPKMVPLTQWNLCASATHIRDSLKLTSEDRCLNIMPLFHIHGLVGAILSMLAAGGSVACSPGFNALKFFEWLQEFNPTWYTGVPTMHQAILRAAGKQAGSGLGSGLRFIRSCSSALPPKLMTQMEAAFSIPVVEAYGMTEASHQIAINSLPPGVRKPGSVGLPTGCEVAIMDEHGAKLPAESVGHIAIRGVAITKGYLNNLAANTESFRNDWFYTGDQGKLDSDGYLYLTGRIKEIINRAGEKISPREVDEAFLEHPAVAQAIAFPIPDERLGEDIGVAVVLRDSSQASEQLQHEFRMFVSRRLAEFKVPRRIIFVPEIPNGPTGKPQRIGLAAKLTIPQLSSSSASKQDNVSSNKATEQRLIALWQELLGVEQFSIHDDFFDLGGDSMLGGQLAVRVRNEFGMALPMFQLFNSPTIARLATWIDSPRKAPAASLEAIPIVPRNGPLPLSPTQQRMWFLAQSEEESAAYITLVALRLQGPLQIGVLEQAFQKIADRHEILRTTYQITEAGPVQIVSDRQRLSLAVLDVDNETDVRLLAQQEAQRPFDLSQDAPWRTLLLRLGENDHVLLLTIHHIASDGWSKSILFRELSIIYESLADGREPLLPALPIQFADYACWQAHIEQEAEPESIDYWRAQLKGIPDLLEIPTDRLRPARQAFRGGVERRLLSQDLRDPLYQLCRQEGATLFMTLLAAFQALLHRYSGQTDICVGVPAAQRTHQEVEHLIGPFINTLVLRADVADDPLFIHHLGKVRETALGAYDHQNLSFERLLAILHTNRSSSHNPLVQVLFQLRNHPDTVPHLHQVVVLPLEFDPGTSPSDLALDIIETTGGLLCLLTYNRDLFEAATAQRLLKYYETLLQAATLNPHQSLSQLQVLSKEESRQILKEWNSNALAVPQKTVPKLFAEQAARTPDALAVVAGDKQLTYAELDEKTNRLARYLVSLGVGPEVRVAVCMERSLEIVVSFLAILKAGGVYVPLDPSYPVERLRYMLDNSRARAVLTNKAVRQRLPGFPGRLLEWEAEQEALERHESSEFHIQTDGQNSAYVIYTSGSTGAPKGVAVSHRNLNNFVASYQRIVDVRPGDRSTYLYSVGFDPTVLELWPFLTAGATLYIPDEELKYQPEALCRWVVSQQITHFSLPTPLAELVFGLDWGALKRGCKLRHLTVGGEAMRIYPPTDFPCDVFNAYGPTENTVITTIAKVSSDPGQSSRPLIGRPMPNNHVYVLDSNLQPCMIGCHGELYIAGDSLARGYIESPDSTAQSFVPDPFSEAPGSRMYKTGDIVRYLPDGHLDFIGRRDSQIKLQGFRIELGEIEAVLRAHDAIEEAAVVLRSQDDTQSLLAFVTSRSNSPGLEHVLTSHLEAALPRYMAPSSIVILEAMPLAPTGKIDRKALLKLQVADLAEEGQSYPSSNTEIAIADIWKEMLRWNAANIPSDLSFFQLGGHSLLAARMISRLNQKFGTRLSVRTVFDFPSIARLAEHVIQMQPSGQEHGLVKVVRSPEGHPLSAAQSSLWVMYKHEPESTAYNLPLAYNIHGTLETATLERCLQIVYRRHESLKTRFVEVDGEPRQFVSNEEEFTVPVIFSSDKDARQRLARESARVFDLENGPLFFGQILRLSQQHHILSMNMHHIVSDGWSIDIIIQEITDLYAGFGDANCLPQIDFQYLDYAHWQLHQTLTRSYELAKEYWRTNLKTAPALLELPKDFARPARLPHRSGIVPFPLPTGLRSGLKLLSQEQNCTLYMVMLAAFQTMLFRYTTQEDIVVGTPVATRGMTELEKIVGHFVNMIALRTNLSGSATFLSLLSDVKHVVLEGFEHQHVAFADVVDALQAERTASYLSVFQVVFAMQEGLVRDLKLAGASCSRLNQYSQDAKFDLMLTIRDNQDELSGSFEFSTELFTQATIERFANCFQVLLSSITEGAARTLTDLELLTQAERRQLLVDFNSSGSVGEIYRDQCIHEIFEAQTSLTPEGTAVICGSASLTYRELNAQATAIACELVTQGADRGDYIGVCMGRSQETIVALLGVLKSGAAYVPLDPGYPDNRLSAIVNDAGLKIFLCDAENSRREWPPDAKILVVADLLAAQSQHQHPDPTRRCRNHDLSHIIFTSGSTGRPKGVMIEHQSVVALLEWCRQTYSAEDLARVLFSTSICFDLSVFEMWAPLTCGGTVQVVDDALALCEAQAAPDVTLINTVPSALRAILDRNGISDTVKVINVAGEPLPGDLVADVFQQSRIQRLYNLYGPTEDTTYSTYACYTEAPQSEPAIGKPISGTQLFVLGPYREILPIGCIGELFIGGAGLARGYLNRPELTHEAFVENLLDGAQRLYKTGDLVRWSPEGDLYFVGRADNQVKVRGYRIELGEIEAHLQAHELVGACVVLAREDEPGNKRLIGYVVPARPTAEETLVTELLAYSRRCMPEYMVPSAYIVLDHLPLTPNGKIDRKRLPVPDSASILHEVYSPPLTGLERQICKIWESVLKVNPIGIRDDFFSLGGNSLLAIRVAGLISKELQVDLPVREILANKTVQNLALAIMTCTQNLPAHLSLEKVGEGLDIQLSYPQMGAWIVAHREGFKTFFNMSFAISIKGNLDIGALHKSLQSIVNRHESLRTRFAERNQEIFLVIDHRQEISFTVVDLTRESAASAQARFETFWQEERNVLLDLQNGPLLRAKLVLLSAQNSTLLLTMHHLISDGWSINIFRKELDVLYGAHCGGEEPRLTPLAIQYSDYAYWLRQWHDTPECARQSQYWIEKLASFPSATHFPTDKEMISSENHWTKYKDLFISRQELDELSRYCTRSGTTLYVLLMAVFHLALYRYSGVNKLIVSSPVAGRNRAELETSIGLYVNMVNILSDVSEDITLGDFIVQMKHTIYEALAHSSVQMTALFANPDFRMPAFPALVFNFIQFPNDVQWKLGDLEVEPLMRRDIERPCLTALDLTFTNGQGGLRGHIGYDTALFHENTVNTIVADYKDILDTVRTGTDKRIGEIAGRSASIR